MNNKKMNLIKELKEHISFLLEFDRFEMARFYCDVASKIFENKPVGNDYLVYLNEDLYDVDKQIMNYLRENK